MVSNTIIIKFWYFTIIFVTKLQITLSVLQSKINKTNSINPLSNVHQQIIISSKANFYQDEEEFIPCSHFNSINITDGIFNTNLSITHNGITYSPEQFRTYDYIYQNHRIKIPTERHIRGCICYYRKCVRACCLPHHQLENGYCIYYNSSHFANSSSFNVRLLDNGKETIRDLLNDTVFGVTYPRHCTAYLMDPERDSKDNWHLELVCDDL